MPWSSSDASRHKSGLNKVQSRAWAEIADSVLSKSGDEGKAIRIANSKASRAKKSVHYDENMRKYGPRGSRRTTRKGKR